MHQECKVDQNQDLLSCWPITVGNGDIEAKTKTMFSELKTVRWWSWWEAVMNMAGKRNGGN